MLVLCRVCHVFPPLFSIFGLFAVLVKCDYELILVQLCLSYYLRLSCVFIVLSVQLISSGLLVTPRCSCVYALPCLALMSTLKTVNFELYPRYIGPARTGLLATDGPRPGALSLELPGAIGERCTDEASAKSVP